MDILTGLTSILGGGITGLLGSVTQRIFEYKTKKLEIELQKNKFENDVALKQLDMQAAVSHDKTVIEVEDSKAFKAALESEPKKYSEGQLTTRQQWVMVFLDFVRGIIRPALTIYLCGITTAIYFQAKTLMGTMIPVDSAYNLVSQIVNTILYLTTTCVLFWFGTRNKSK